LNILLTLIKDIEDWNQKLLDTFCKENASSETPSYHEQAFINIMTVLKSVSAVQKPINGRLFVCVLAPFFLLLEDTGS
jgi:predicted PurR-regulated permease PerM